MRLRLRTILLVVNLVVISLPLGGIAVLRLYESVLVRQTETELIAQGAFITAAYRAALLRWQQQHPEQHSWLTGYGLPIAPRWIDPDNGSRWRPRPAVLDLAVDPVNPPAPPGLITGQPIDPIARTVGREINPVLRDAQVITLAGIRVVNYQGLIVASTGSDRGRSLLNYQEILRALEGETVSLLRRRLTEQPDPPLNSISRGTGIRVIVAMPIVYRQRILGAVLLVRTPANITQALYSKRYPLLYSVLVLLALALLLSLFTSLTLDRPIRALIDQAERAVRGEKQAVVPLARPVTQEIAQLSAAFATLVRDLEARSDYIRNFAAHVSHEFKTPLTAIKGSLELLEDHHDSMEPAERQRFLAHIGADTDRLERLVRQLLELTRADTAVSIDRSAVLNPARIVTRLRRRYPALTGHGPDQTVSVSIDEQTLESLLIALVDNSYQHSGPDVSVTAVAELTGRQLIFTVTDNGPGIAADDHDRIFEPFFTTARSRGGTGLGLAVVKALVLAHRGQVELLPTDGPGTCLRLSLACQSTVKPSD